MVMLMMRLPGIPAPGMPDAHEFWLSFYASLYSGLLAGLTTGLVAGLVVGLVLLLTQGVAEKRRFQQDCERDLASFRERLRGALDQPDILCVTEDAARSIPRAAAVVAAVGSQPIDLWLETLRNRTVFLGRIKELQQSHSAFLGAASKLNLRLRQIVRHYNASRQVDDINDSFCQEFILGRIYGLSPDQLAPILGLSTGAVPERETGYAQACADPAIRELVPAYGGARTRLAEAVISLQKELDVPPAPAKRVRWWPFGRR
jgi:hypothetical protein